MELSPEDEKALRESLSTWKEEVYAQMLEEVEEVKAKKIEELEEANIQYQEELKEEYTEKMLDALEEMREQVKTEVLSEMVDSNPELHILEEIKELIAPTLNEDYLGNVYSEQVSTLIEENNELKEQIRLEEGAKTLAELLAPYSEKTQRIILSMMNEGGPEEVTEQFYELIESLKGVDEDDEDLEDDYDEEFDDEFEEDEDLEDEDVDEDEEEDFESYIEEGEAGSEDEEEEPKKTNPLLNEIKGLSS
jgi:hypothetical protein